MESAPELVDPTLRGDGALVTPRSCWRPRVDLEPHRKPSPSARNLLPSAGDRSPSRRGQFATAGARRVVTGKPRGRYDG